MLTDSIDLTLRAVKGAALTWDEADANFVRLREAVLGVTQHLNANRLVLGAEPAIGDRDGVAWIPADFSGIFVWDGSAWNRVREPVLYAASTGTANTYAITLSSGIAPDMASLVGRLICVKINASNTDASTLAVNAFAAVDIVRNGTLDLVANNMVANGMYLFVYDGTVFHLLNPLVSTSADRAVSWESALFDPPTPLSPATTITHSLGAVPSTVRIVAVVREGGATISGWNVGDELLISSFGADKDSGHTDTPLFTSGANATHIVVAAHQASNGVMFTKRNGTVNEIDNYADFVAAFALKIYATLEGQSSVDLASQVAKVCFLSERQASTTDGTTLTQSATTAIVLNHAEDPDSLLVSHNTGTGEFRPISGRYRFLATVPLAPTVGGGTSKHKFAIQLYNVTQASVEEYMTAAIVNDSLTPHTITFQGLLESADGEDAYVLRVQHAGSTGVTEDFKAGLAAGIADTEERFTTLQLTRYAD